LENFSSFETSTRLIAGSGPKPYLKVGTLQASHTSATSDGTKAVRYPSIRKFIAPVSISEFGDSLPKIAMTCFQGSFRRALFFLENS